MKGETTVATEEEDVAVQEEEAEAEVGWSKGNVTRATNKVILQETAEAVKLNLLLRKPEATEEDFLFMALMEHGKEEKAVWFIDSGCSNHMIGMKEMFRELDETQRMVIRLGNNKQIQVE
ncbi:hypothetical protein NL676_018239 [Syzygium grande]|nr:hypothetical protein NL676_018239 [Syzygium grande]